VTGLKVRISFRHGKRGGPAFRDWRGRTRTGGGTEAFKGIHLSGEAIFDLVQGVLVVFVLVVVITLVVW
jgi:hypothetical protein